jgi:hypothetical protein
MKIQHIDGMVRKLLPVLKNPEQAKVILQRYWRERMALVWEVADVHRAANERGRAVNKGEAAEVLQVLHRQHNPQIGLRWNDLWEHLDLYQPGRALTRSELKHFVERDQITVAK